MNFQKEEIMTSNGGRKFQTEETARKDKKLQRSGPMSGEGD